eukprot:TRINITY_DN29332_c0_g1_i2.p1 TRINITY_DN29332_c0_g1~~TRINITY_DN29332_c0_g1_i2.p1  ORF type:complete len:118 (-),score=16.31 TRINITY_DN29332_c0_g1_i2:215-568(-)
MRSATSTGSWSTPSQITQMTFPNSKGLRDRLRLQGGGVLPAELRSTVADVFANMCQQTVGELAAHAETADIRTGSCRRLIFIFDTEGRPVSAASIVVQTYVNEVPAVFARRRSHLLD